MRRISLWALSTLSALVLLLGYHTSTSGPTSVTGTTTATGSFSSSGSASAGASSTADAGGSGGTDDDEGEGDDTTTDGSSSSSPSASPTSAPTSGAAPTASTTTVTGSVAQTRWGPVQVQLTLSGTRITQASVLQYPQGNGRDIEINDQALPILTQETVDAQSASIDMVSGATVTSDGYLESLQSALDQAGL